MKPAVAISFILSLGDISIANFVLLSTSYLLKKEEEKDDFL